MPSKVSIGGANFPASHGDSRSDLGYARLDPKYHVPKMLGNNSYPYRDEDEDLDYIDLEVEIDDETLDALHRLITPPQDYDPGGGHYDPFSFAGGNTNLHGPSHIGEASAISGLVPFPNMYKGRGGAAVGGTKVGTARGEGSTTSATIDPGDRWGWSNPRYKKMDELSDEEDNYTLEDIADSLEEHYLRRVIRMFIREHT